MEKRPNGWTSPSTLLGILGFASIVYSAYLAFQRDVESRLSVVETKVAAHEKQIDRLFENPKERERR